MNLTPQDKLIKAKVQLQKHQPFFSYLVMSMTFIESTQVPSMGVTKSGVCYYNPQFIDTLTTAELEGVVSHEVLHIVLEHLDRIHSRDHQLANISQDIVVNDIVLSNDLELPSIGLIPEYHNHTIEVNNIRITHIDKKTWEDIYEILEQQMPNISTVITTSIDNHIREDEERKTEGIDQTPNWNQIINEAYVYSKNLGQTPKGVDRYIKNLTYPKLPWKHLLYKYIINEIPYDFSIRPSKRSISLGIYRPEIKRDTTLQIVIALDTSGSISNEDLQDIVTEVYSIVQVQGFNIKLTVLTCDAEIQSVTEITSISDIEKLISNLKGGGGTNFIPVFKWMENNNKQLNSLLIYFTDGEGVYPEYTNIKTLWVIKGSESRKPPFGKVIYLE